MKKSMMKTSLVALATVAAVSSASAMDTIFEFYTNDQVNLADVISDADIKIDSVTNNVDVTGSALGNNIAVQAHEDVQSVNADFSQRSETDNIISFVDVDIDSTKNFKLNSEAMANKAIIVNKNKDGHNQITGTQFSAAAPPPPPPPVPAPRPAGDPLSDVSVILGTTETFDLNSSAGGNFAQFQLGGTSNVVELAQENSVLNQSLVDVTVGSITDSMDLNSRAWGNSSVTILGNPSE